MKFQVEHDALAEAVAWVARALPSRPVVPVLSGLRLDAAEGLTLSCFDYELSATTRLPADIAEPGTALVPGRLLAEITRSLPGQPAEFRSDGDEVTLSCGSAEFALVSLPTAEYPELPPAPPLAGTVDGGDLAAALAQVLPATSRDDTLPMLTGVCLDIRGDVVTLAATDRYRLAVRDLRWAPTDPGIRAIALVPGRTLADAARVMLPGVPVSVSFVAPDGHAPVTEERGREPAGVPGGRPPGQAPGGSRGGLPPGQAPGGSRGGLPPGQAPGGSRGGLPPGPTHAGRAGRGDPRPVEGMISFDSGGRRLTGRLIAGEFIRYESRFPAEYGCRAEMPAASLIEAVRRVSLVADRASPVRLTFGSGTVAIEAQTEGRARALERVTASFHGDEPTIAFNPHYLLDGITAAAAVSGPARHPASSASADGGAAGDQAADGASDARDGAARPATIRLEFTSPARPALITLAGDDGDDSGSDGTAAGDGDKVADDAAADRPRPAFRYLVVPLRSPGRA
jgi:DNA polymerase-3 subunit beta